MQNGYKAQLPTELMYAMQLSTAQFEELEVDVLNVCLRSAEALADLDCIPEVPTEIMMAFRPANNPKEQYFDVRLSFMMDRNGSPDGGYGIRCEVAKFKPMSRSEYIAYCIKEFGEAPPLLAGPEMN